MEVQKTIYHENQTDRKEREWQSLKEMVSCKMCKKGEFALTTEPRIIDFSHKLMITAHGTKLQFCKKCRIDFNIHEDKQLVRKGNGKTSSWYHIKCAKLVNLI